MFSIPLFSRSPLSRRILSNSLLSVECSVGDWRGQVSVEDGGHDLGPRGARCVRPLRRAVRVLELGTPTASKILLFKSYCATSYMTLFSLIFQ
jgi:hypothetical protein